MAPEFLNPPHKSVCQSRKKFGHCCNHHMFDAGLAQYLGQLGCKHVNRYEGCGFRVAQLMDQLSDGVQRLVLTSPQPALKIPKATTG